METPNNKNKPNREEFRGRNENANEEECKQARKRLNKLFHRKFRGKRVALRNSILQFSSRNPRIARLRSTFNWPGDSRIIKNFQSGAEIELGNLEFLLHYLDFEETSSLLSEDSEEESDLEPEFK